VPSWALSGLSPMWLLGLFDVEIWAFGFRSGFVETDLGDRLCGRMEERLWLRSFEVARVRL
jgi:hypothetical protein